MFKTWVLKMQTYLLLLLMFTGGLALPAWGHDGKVVLECTATGTGGALAADRGILFYPKGSFASVELRIWGSVADTYQFMVELRRSGGFTDPILATVRVTKALGNGYEAVHVDFPPEKVNGNEVFSIKLVDIFGAGTLYFLTTPFGSIPCPEAVITETNDVWNPTPIASAAGMRVLAPPANCADCRGDLNGDLVVDLLDFQILSANWLKVCIPVEMPLLTVKNASIPLAVVQSLAEQFGIDPKLVQNDNGIWRFTDPAKFQAIPTNVLGKGPVNEDERATTLEAIDFGGISGKVLGDAAALKLIATALKKSGLEFPGGLDVTPVIGHTMFQAVGTRGDEIIHVPLDTQVSYAFKFGTIPLTGPGAKLKFVLNGDGQLTHMTLAMPMVETGGSYEVIPQEEADAMASALYGFGNPAGAAAAPAGAAGATSMGAPNLTSQLVYWAPADASNLTHLLPVYLYGGTAINPLGGPDIELRKIKIQAYNKTVADVLPKTQLYLSYYRGVMHAGTESWGGTPPYTYSWTSSNADVTSMSGPGIQYMLNPRAGMPDPATETVTVLVTDVAGVSTLAVRTISLLSAGDEVVVAQSEPILPTGGVLDVGTEWVGVSQGLGGSASNAYGFVFWLGATGANVRFNWGDLNAWERDYKDPSVAGGDDTNWIDNVDAAFYTGHANGDGFTFSSAVNDGFLHYNEAKWGNNDLEWLVIAACGPLQLDSGGKAWHQRWGPAFQRLHLLCAYQTSSADNTAEGTKYALYMLGGLTVREAWIRTAIEVQPNGVWYGVMGVIGQDGWSNWNDHYWGHGTVGPDIYPSQKIGYWLVYGPC